MGTATRLERESKEYWGFFYLLFCSLSYTAWAALTLMLMVDMSSGHRYTACALTTGQGLQLCSGAAVYILGWTLLLPGAVAAALACGFWGYRHR
jgi:hypothetical protein